MAKERRGKVKKAGTLLCLLLALTFLSAACGEYPGIQHPLAAEEAPTPPAAGEAPAGTTPADTAPSPETLPAAQDGGQEAGQPQAPQEASAPPAAEGETPAGTTPADTAPTPETPPVEQNGGAETAEPEALQSTLEIVEKDFKLVPDKLTAKAGKITFVLKNRGRYTHDFRVKGQGIDEKAPKIGAGRTFEWQVTLTPGSYEISCPISNHAKRGMTGTLKVGA